MTDRYPYRHHGPAVHGSKLTDYLISEANMIEDIEQLRAENARLRETQDALINIVEGIGVMSHGTWRNDHGKRLKDTREWVRFYNTRAVLSAEPAPVAGVTMQEAAKVLAEAMSLRMWQYYPIEMPVTKEGLGPATVGVDAVSIEYEVWRATDLSSIGSYKNLPDAITSALRAIAGENGNENG